MKENSLVSIIVPVYNTEKYIELTLKSIVEQKYRNFELILVDDTGNDSAMQVARNFLKNYHIPVTFLKQPNRGLSAARNFGLEKSNGKYVCFIDSDDIISSTFLSDMLEHIHLENLYVAFCDFEICNEENRFGKKIGNKKKLVLSSQEVFNNYFLKKFKVHNCSLLISKSFLSSLNLIFNEKVKFGEDALFMLELFSQIKKIGYIKSYNYKYLHRANSIMSTGKINDITNFISIYENKLIELSKKDLINQNLSSMLLERYKIGSLNTIARTNSFTSFMNFHYKIMQFTKLKFYISNGLRYNLVVFFINYNISLYYKIINYV